MKKRIISIIVVLLLLAALFPAAAFADSGPTVYSTDGDLVIQQNKLFDLHFTVYHAYTYEKLCVYIYYGSISGLPWVYNISENYNHYGVASTKFTISGDTIDWPTGNYVIQYYTMYKSGDQWYTGTKHTKSLTVIEGPDTPFTDISENAYYYTPLLWAYDYDIVSGTSKTTFSPTASCNRAQLVTFIWRTFGRPEPESTSCSFKDVSSDSYYYKAVLWAVENGITSGYNATTFAPNDKVTRAQTVTFLWRAAGKPAPQSYKCGFTDVSLGSYYCEAVLWAVENGITSGYNATTFAPDDVCNRAQCVSFLYRFVNSFIDL